MQTSLKNNLLRVSIGIPAFNEENTIASLLTSILRQKEEGFVLEKVMVMLDGSTDSTAAIVNGLAQKFPQIELIAYTDQKGKCQRLNELYRLNTSDILVTFDADVMLKDNLTLSRMVNKFSDPAVVLVSAADAPVQARTFVHRIVNTWYMLWRYICRDFHGGNNIYNVHGNASALRREFAASVTYPENITADQDFLYLSMAAQKKQYRFAEDAVVLFQTPDTLRDFMFQTNRFLSEKAGVLPMFGEWVSGEYQIPLLYKIERVFMYFLENPLLFPLSMAVYAYIVLFYRQKDPLNAKGLWQPVSSTKRAFKTR